MLRFRIHTELVPTAEPAGCYEFAALDDLADAAVRRNEAQMGALRRRSRLRPGETRQALTERAASGVRLERLHGLRERGHETLQAVVAFRQLGWC